MPILRGLLAVVAGFMTMAVVVGVITGILMKRAPEWVGSMGHPQPAYVAVNLSYSLLGAMAGGYVAAWIAGENRPLLHALILAFIVLVLGGVSAFQQQGLQPVWYQLLLLVLAPLGVLFGGLIRIKVT